MKLAKPEDVTEEPFKPDNSENVDAGTVEVEAMGGGKMPVSDAIGETWDQMYAEINHLSQERGALQDRVDELEEQNEELRETVDQVSEVVQVLSAESGYTKSECDACGGDLKEKGGTLSKKHIKCESCGDVIAGKP